MNEQVPMSEKHNYIAKFINNTSSGQSQDELKIVLLHLRDLCKQRVTNKKFSFVSESFCAYSGEPITGENEKNVIVIKGHNVLSDKIEKYYVRDNILDISIGDLKFKKFLGQIEEMIEEEISSDLLKNIFGTNLNQQLIEADKHYSKRLAEPLQFTCSKTNKQYFNSDKIKIDNQDVSIYWAIDNLDSIKNQLSEPLKKYIESQKRLINSQYNPNISQITQSSLLGSQIVQQNQY